MAILRDTALENLRDEEYVAVSMTGVPLEDYRPTFRAAKAKREAKEKQGH